MPQPAVKTSVKTRLLHAVTGHYPPENAGWRDMLRLAAASPRAIAGSLCALVAAFFLWQSALFLYNPYSRLLLRPHNRLDEKVADRQAALPPPARRESASLECVKQGAQTADIKEAYEQANPGVYDPMAPKENYAPPPGAARHAARSGNGRGAVRPAAQAGPEPDEMSIPLLRDSAPSNADNIMKSTGVAVVLNGVDKDMDSTLLANASAAQSLPDEFAGQASTAALPDTALPKGLSLAVPPPPVPRAQTPGWVLVLALALLPLALAELSARLENELAAELCARGAFVLALVLAASGLHDIVSWEHVFTGALALAVGVWQVRLTHRRMVDRFGLAPTALIARLRAFAGSKGWI